MVETPPTSRDSESSEVKALNVAAYPIAAAAGGVFLKSTVDDKLYDNLKSLNQLPELAEHKTAFRSAQMGEQAAENLTKFHKEFSKIYDEKLHKLGFTNFTKRFNGLHSNQKFDALIHGATAVGVTLGVVLTIANSKFLDKFNHKDKDKSDTQGRSL